MVGHLGSLVVVRLGSLEEVRQDSLVVGHRGSLEEVGRLGNLEVGHSQEVVRQGSLEVGHSLVEGLHLGQVVGRQDGQEVLHSQEEGHLGSQVVVLRSLEEGRQDSPVAALHMGSVLGSQVEVRSLEEEHQDGRQGGQEAVHSPGGHMAAERHAGGRVQVEVHSLGAVDSHLDLAVGMRLGGHVAPFHGVEHSHGQG